MAITKINGGVTAPKGFLASGLNAGIKNQTKKDMAMQRSVEKIYLPNGTWYDFKTGKRFNGNTRYVMFFNDEDYPVFAKKGSIIPMYVQIGRAHV